jgi:uncharacterized integral membrane protein
MLSVILLVIIALAFGIFATQNTIGVPITFGSFVIPEVPLYVVLAVTLLIGLLFAWLISLANSLLYSRRLHDKDSAFASLRKENELLKQRNAELEIENTRLSAESKQL